MINLQELEFDHLLEYHALHKYIMNQYIQKFLSNHCQPVRILLLHIS